MSLAQRATNHSPVAPDHDIAGGSENVSRHPDREIYTLSNLKRIMHIQQHAAGRNIACKRRAFRTVAGNYSLKGKRKTHSAPDFLPFVGWLNVTVFG